MENEEKVSMEFEPEIYCLSCRLMDWDQERKTCANFNTQDCPLVIRQVLQKLNVSCLVV